MKKKTVKELEKKLKASEEYYWSQVQQEKREKEKLLADLKDLREKLRKKDGNLKNLQKEIRSTEATLADRNKRLSKLSAYAELEKLAGRYKELSSWKERVLVSGALFRFEMREHGVELFVDVYRDWESVAREIRKEVREAVLASHAQPPETARITAETALDVLARMGIRHEHKYFIYEIESLRDAAKELSKTIETAIEKEKEFTEVKERLEVVRSTIETLHSVLPAKEQAKITPEE